MRSDYYFDSKGIGQIHVSCWKPEGKPKAVFQIVHGIAEHAERYGDFASWLNQQGYVVVAEDHMGHGKSINNGGVQGYFHGGWFTAVADTHALLVKTRSEYPNIPYILFGHSMGSFMARTLLSKYPASEISAAIICGTGWQPRQMLPAIVKVAEVICKTTGERKPSEVLQGMAFGSYNKRVEHPRTVSDWLSRDAKSVDAYLADPLCGFTASSGLMRDMMKGIQFIEQPKNLANMRKDLPIFFIAGGDDPVGEYGKGVTRAADEFRKVGMQDVTCKLYPLCRHELLNEINHEEIYRDIVAWIDSHIIFPEQ